MIFQSVEGEGARVDSMVNICERLINVVIFQQAEDIAPGLSQNGKGSGMDAPNSSIADGEPPAERQNLTHTGYLHGTW